MTIHQTYLEKIEKVIQHGRYKDDWDSLSGREMPTWMYKGKLGIFIHWGVYSVPAFVNEWYSRNMYIQDKPEFDHHIKKWGLHKEFGYKDFIPLFTAQHFNPEKWSELFAKAGAKYVIPVAEHHDGFQMYDSEISKWNAKQMGPQRDVLGELKKAFSSKGLVTGVSNHRVEHWFFMGHGKAFNSDVKEPLVRGDFYWPAMKEAESYDLFSEPTPTDEFLEDWLVRCCEIVDRYQPLQFYFDWWIQHVSVKPYLKKFAAYYYNRAIEWGEEVTICYKHDSLAFGTGTVDIERGKFAQPQTFRWQTDTAIAKNSWCWTENNRFKSVKSIICNLLDIISKNGVLLLNVGPKPDGSISIEDETVLLGLGKWLEENGEAVYDTIPWRFSSEGPTVTKEGQFTDNEEIHFTSEDFRFTCKGKNIYASCLNWPESGEVSIRSLALEDASSLPVFNGIIEAVEIIGGSIVEWSRNEVGLKIKAAIIHHGLPVVVKVSVA